MAYNNLGSTEQEVMPWFLTHTTWNQHISLQTPHMSFYSCFYPSVLLDHFPQLLSFPLSPSLEKHFSIECLVILSVFYSVFPRIRMPSVLWSVLYFRIPDVMLLILLNSLLMPLGTCTFHVKPDIVMTHESFRQSLSLNITSYTVTNKMLDLVNPF